MTSTPANERSRASTISTSQPQPPANLGKEDAADWLAIDRALSHIQSVNPSDPYVLTIPQDVEPRYHHPNQQQARQWLAHAPFGEKEHEASQYLTWHFYEPGSDTYVQHSTRPREEREDASSRVGTPKVGSGGAKKTMSLGAYKKKVAAGTPGPEETKKAEVNGDTKDVGTPARKKEGDKSVKKPAVKGPVERLKADEEVLAAVEDSEDVVPPVAANKKDEGKKDLKRKREEGEEEDGKETKRKREDSKMSDGRQEQKAEEKKLGNGIVERDSAKQPAKPQFSPTKDVKAQTAEPESQSEEPTAKKAKTSTPRDTSAVSQTGTKAAYQAPPKQELPTPPDKARSPPPKLEDDTNDMALPPRLSPLRENDDSKDDGEDVSLLLPPRLSPTLPANIMATLDARKHYRSTSISSAAGDNLSPPRKALENGIAKRKSPVNGFRANPSSPMVRSDAEETRGRAKTSAPRVRSPSPGDEAEIAAGKAAAATRQESTSKLLVKLKFKQRSTRETVKQLLKLPAAKKKPEAKPSPATLQATDARHREQRDVNAKGVAQKVGPATKGVAKKVEKSATPTPAPPEKRAREESVEAEGRAAKRKKADIAVYEPPGKRTKAPPEALGLKNSTTPATPARPTPQPPTPASSVQKPASQPTPNLTAPKKSGNELLAAATKPASMKREPSHDSQAQALTPSGSSSSPAAFSASQPPVSAVPKSTPTTASTPATAPQKIARQKEWDAQRKTLADLGRELKQAATADITASQSSKSTGETEKLRHLAAVKAVESLLTYILAFASDDEAELAAEVPKPLRPLHWRTLKDYFPFVKRHTEGFPILQGLACMLAVVFCSRILELSVEEKSNSSVELVSQAWVLLSHSATDAEVKLDLRKLQQTFPKAWAGSADASLADEKLELGKFAGTYKLPLGPQTKPVRAVRAAHAMLREWNEKEGLEYEMRLKLE